MTSEVLPVASLPDDGEGSLYERLIDLVSEGIYFVDRDRRIVFWNAAAERITGYTAQEVLGKCCSDGLLLHCNGGGEILCGTSCPLVGTMRDGQPRQMEAFVLHHDGRRVPVKARSNVVRGANGEIVGCAELFVDASSINAMLDELRSVREYASIDPLTGIGNRRMIQERLAAFGGKRRGISRQAGVIFFDIDDFKAINDTYGHDVGDRAIKEVASTATALLRSFDTIGRWGGDEFVVIIPGSSLSDAEAKAKQIQARAFGEVILSRGSEGICVNVGAGVGVAEYESGETATEFFERADQLLLEEKRYRYQTSTVLVATVP